jgi:rhamnulokinase
MEIDTPIINQQGLTYNVTNEGGVESTIRLLKNLDGLWLIQECRRIWAQQGHNYSYNDLTKLAAAAPPFKTLIDPDDGSFLTPSDMPARMTEFCTRTGQTPPDSHGAFIRCALESLAFKYRWVIEQLETLTGRAVEVLHIVGGGTQNQLLNQFAANATGRRVVTGPIEATAIGNILLQMLAVGQIDSLSQGREIVQGSFPMNTYTPQDQAIWDEVYPRFTTLLL